jgi:LmbE family N-acetylglucosaminyl deacetylase
VPEPTPQRILVLAPHIDDGEFGAGGSIARWVREGHDVYYAAFSVCEQSVPDGLSKDILEHELASAMRVLQIPDDRVRVYRYQVRYFPTNRQEILEDLIRLRADVRPELVLVPSLHDIHQDHGTIASEAIRAFKNASMLGYEMPWNNLSFETTSFVLLEESDVTRKIEALASYESQRHRPYASSDFLRGLARTRGTQIGATYAEAFQVIRWVIT